jgi:hypothetical protein
MLGKGEKKTSCKGQFVKKTTPDEIIKHIFAPAIDGESAGGSSQRSFWQV